MLISLVISSIAHDWIYKNHGFTEDEFKSALFAHKVYEDPSVAMQM